MNNRSRLTAMNLVKLSIVATTLLLSLILIHVNAYSLERNNDKVIYFGIVPQQSPSKLAQNWGPLIEKISEETGLNIKFVTAPSIPEFEKRLAKHEYDIAYMNPYHYVIFSEKAGYKAIAKQSDKLLKGIIVVPVDSLMSSVYDLYESDIAFPAPLAFAATIIPRSYLSESGITYSANFVNSHDSVYMSVARGFFEAGGGVMRTFNNIPEETKSKLRILWTSEGFIPHSIAVSPNINEQTKNQLSDALINIKDPELLKNLGFSGIEAAEDSQWNSVRQLKVQ